MKRLFLLSIFLVLAAYLFAQTPQTLNYQGVARNANGQPLANSAIVIRLKIKAAPFGPASLYSETRSVTTNAFGLFTVVINSAGALSKTGDFTTIDWATGSKYLETEIDPAGGSNFTSLGVIQLQSVPFALQSAKAADLEFPRADYFNNSGTTVWLLENNGTTAPLHTKNAGTGGALFATATSGSAITATTNTNLATRGAVDGSNTGIDGFGVRGTASHANSVGVEAVNGTGLALNVNGRVKIAGGNTNPGAGKVLTSDANGNATWQVPASPAINKVGFAVASSAGGGLENMPSNQWYKYHPGVEQYDAGNDFAPVVQGMPTSSTFAVPVSGFYHFNAQISIGPPYLLAAFGFAEIRLVVQRNGAITELASSKPSEHDARQYDEVLQLSADVPLLAGDRVWLEILAFSPDGNCKIMYGPKTYFSGYLIFAN